MPAFDDAFARVKQLVADFQANENFYLSPQYQEQEARHDFIDKFWIALGWDVNHDTQKNPFEQEVKVERKEHGTSQRRADYAFYLLPNFRDVKFYVEAKKPYGDIATADNYFQAARYGWSSHTPLAVLHDFEQFEIIDCRYRPHIDTALAQNLRKYHYTQYLDPEKFSEIYWLFSREAVANGSLEKFAEALPKKRGKAVQRGLFPGAFQSIDEAFLEELDEHREALAKAFKNENAELDGETLTELVQRTLDRLVFLRFLEDKHIEPQNHIAYFGDKGTAWQDFIAQSRRLDGIYNGIVYKQHPILDDPKFKPDDEIFSGICERLSHINSSFDFNAVPIHILGSIYERFLGKVIVTTDKRARVEEKPEVRKAGGVYYTPEYIVRYIVENTVGKLIEGKTPAQIAELRFADIACGSGSFLLGVYDLLLRYHTRYYNENPDKAKIGGKGKKEQKADCVEREDGLHLSLQKKREILLNNIYGVDIDTQAVEVAQLSLYLKLLQDETPGSTREHQLEFHEALLPSLHKNIVCGNSLIGTDILDGQLFASDEERKLNPMNFEDAFPHIFKRKSFGELKETATPLDFDLPGVPLHGSYSKKKLKDAPKAKLPPEFQGGFDAIVGNPPYVRIQTTGQRDLKYFSNRYETATGNFDIYCVFIEKSLSLLRPNGRFGYIVPHRFFKTDYGEGLRGMFVKRGGLQSIVDFDGFMVFEEANINTAVIIAAADPSRQFNFAQVRKHSFPANEVASELSQNHLDGPVFRGDCIANLDETSSAPWVFLWNGEERLWKRMSSLAQKLGDVTEQIFQGLKTGSDPIFIGKLIGEKKGTLSVAFGDQGCVEVEKAIMRPLIKGENMKRFRITPPARVILFPYEAGKLIPAKEFSKEFPNAWKYLLSHKDFLSKREDEALSPSEWYAYTRRQALVSMEQPKIVTPDYYAHSSFGLDQEGVFFFCGGGAGGYGIVAKQPHDVRFLLGLLNSRLLDWYLRKISLRAYQTAFMYVKKYIEQLPICSIRLDDATDKSRHDRMVQLVEQMLEAKKQLAGAQTDKDRTYYENKCASLDRQIDALVYDLYGLTEAEIKIVEGTS